MPITTSTSKTLKMRGYKSSSSQRANPTLPADSRSKAVSLKMRKALMQHKGAADAGQQ